MWTGLLDGGPAKQEGFFVLRVNGKVDCLYVMIAFLVNQRSVESGSPSCSFCSRSKKGVVLGIRAFSQAIMSGPQIAAL